MSDTVGAANTAERTLPGSSNAPARLGQLGGQLPTFPTLSHVDATSVSSPGRGTSPTAAIDASTNAISKSNKTAVEGIGRATPQARVSSPSPKHVAQPSRPSSSRVQSAAHTTTTSSSDTVAPCGPPGQPPPMSTMASSGVPLIQPASGSSPIAPSSPSPAPPSPPFPPVPSFPPPPGSSQPVPSPSSPVNQRSNSGTPTGRIPSSGRSSYFLDGPSRSSSASARNYTNSEHRESSGVGSEYTTPFNDNNSNNSSNETALGTVHGNITTYNRNDNTRRSSNHRTTPSFTTSTEKAAMLIDQAAPGVFQVDFGLGHGRGISQTSGNTRGHGQGYDDGRTTDSRYQYPVNQFHTNVSAPLQNFTQNKLGAVAEGIWQGVNGGFTGGGGGGGGGGGKYDAEDMYIDDDRVGIPYLPRTVQERLQPTINHAMEEEAKYAKRAKITGYALNCAIGLQVLLSALITALSAVTTGRNTQIMTSILGGVGTVVASYLARARGSNEPELSIARTKDLQRFVRRCDAFVQDHGMETGFEGDVSGEGGAGDDGAEGGDGERQGDEKIGKRKVLDLKRAKELDDRIREFRIELEHLLGNGNGERRLAPPV